MQERLRNKLIEMKELEGISYTYVCKNLSISKTTISLFINSKRNLSKPVEDRLIRFLERYTKY